MMFVVNERTPVGRPSWTVDLRLKPAVPTQNKLVDEPAFVASCYQSVNIALVV